MTTDPVTRSVEIPEAAVEAAAQAYMDTRFAGARFIVTPKNAEGMRAALSAALPYLAPAEPACRCSVDVSTEQGIPDRLVADGDCPTHGEPAGDGGLREALLYVLTKWGVGGWKYEDAEGYRERVCNSLMVALAARPAAPADPEDTRTEEERGFVEEALAAADSGDAGHWPTVADYLADEVRRLRAAPAGDGGLREALEKLCDRYDRIAEEVSIRGGVKASYDIPGSEIRYLLAAHPAAPAVPQPVDREALRERITEAVTAAWVPLDVGCERIVDAVLAVLAGEQEQVESQQ